MRLIDLGDYLSGDLTFSARKDIQYPNSVVSCLASYFMGEYELEEVIGHYNHPAEFYADHSEIIKLPIVPDSAESGTFEIKDNKVYTSLPAEEFTPGFYNEVFYTMRVGKQFDESFSIPCRQLFYLSRFAEMFNNEFVWLPKVYPESLITELCSEGYIKSGKSPAALINSIFKTHYSPLTSTSRCSAGEDGWFYAYVGNEDTLVRIPPILKSVLTPADIFSLKFDGNFVCTAKMPIHEYIVGCRGIYLSGNPFDVDVI